MRVEYLIDGYNLMLARPGGRFAPGPGNLERARLALVSWIAGRVIDPSAVTIVFDAAKAPPDAPGPYQRLQGINLHFAKGYANADTLIAELCHQHSFPRQLAVVSNDREVQKAARGRRAMAWTCEQFEKLLERSPAGGKANTSVPEKPQSVTAEQIAYWRGVFSTDSAAASKLRGSPNAPEPLDQQFLRDMLSAFDEIDPQETR